MPELKTKSKNLKPDWSFQKDAINALFKCYVGNTIELNRGYKSIYG